MADNESNDSDEGLELPGISLKQDIGAAEKQVEGLYSKANQIRDDLRTPMQQEREGDGCDSILDVLKEVMGRVGERRPAAWRAGRRTLAESPTAEGELGEGVPGKTGSIADLHSELESIQQKLKEKQEKAGGLKAAAAPKHADPAPPAAAAAEGAAATGGGALPEGEVSARIQRAEEAVRKEFKTDLKVLKLENDDLRAEREDLDMQIISLKLDKEEAEHRVEQVIKEAEKAAAELKAEVKKAERSKIQAAAVQLQKEMAEQHKRKMTDLERKLKAQAEEEQTDLLEKVADLEDEVQMLQGSGGEAKLHQIIEEMKAAHRRELDERNARVAQLETQLRQQA